MSQTNSAEEHKLVSSFESVRRTLLQEEYRDRLEKPLAYWALPNDRRLPLAFLGRSLGELLTTPFDDLSSTRGIGQKKISSLVKLLHRATHDTPPAVPYGLQELADEFDREHQREVGSADACEFDPSVVSEALWVQWCETVQAFHLGHEKLGRLAPSLQALPTVIWDRPLSSYVGRTLAEIRQLKTHGEKRVRVVLEVFHTVHEALHRTRHPQHLSFSLVPAFVPVVDEYLARINRFDPITEARHDIAEQLVKPLLAQTLTDAGEAVYSLSRDRLGIDVPMHTVREQAARWA